jgi:hypothetical protein
MNGMWSHNKQVSTKVFARVDYINIDRKSTLLIYSIDLPSRPTFRVLYSTTVLSELARASELRQLEVCMAEAISKRLRRRCNPIAEKL